MINEETNPLNIIEEANSRTLDYFDKTYVKNLELVQSLKTELFELEIQIETLEKTRELYTYHVDNRRNVFSPHTVDSSQTISKGKQIALQIKDLEDTRERLKARIIEAEQDAIFFREQVEMLAKASKCIHTVLVGSNHNDTSEDIDLSDAIEFIESEDTEEKTTHNYNMLRLQDYEYMQYAVSLDQNIKEELVSNLNKIDTLKWLLTSDIGRAKITLDELHHSQKSILTSLENILDNLNYNLDIKQPVQNLVNQLMNDYKQSHPECMIDASCDCSEPGLHLSPIITIRLIRMLKEVLDNIFKHSNANKITSRISISSRLIDVHVNDNGVGIPEDYLERSAWNSGLHKVHEIIYQLDGNLQIQGDLISGTNVRFSFPVKE